MINVSQIVCIVCDRDEVLEALSAGLRLFEAPIDALRSRLQATASMSGSHRGGIRSLLVSLPRR